MLFLDNPSDQQVRCWWYSKVILNGRFRRKKKRDLMQNMKDIDYLSSFPMDDQPEVGNALTRLLRGSSGRITLSNLRKGMLSPHLMSFISWIHGDSAIENPSVSLFTTSRRHPPFQPRDFPWCYFLVRYLTKSNLLISAFYSQLIGIYSSLAIF